MTEKQKEWIKKYHSRFPAEYMIGETRPKSAAQKEIEELFPEAFAEPKPERESIDVRIEWDATIHGEEMWITDLKELTKTLEDATSDFSSVSSNITVTELPQFLFWTDELVSKFVDEWESCECKRFADCMEDFKQKNNIE